MENEPDKSVLGNLVAMDDMWILLQGYDEDGADDGYTLRLVENVFLIVENSRYIRKLRALRGERAWASASNRERATRFRACSLLQ